MGRTITAREVLARIHALGGYEVRQKGSHATYRAERRDAKGALVASAQAVVPIHSGDLAPGTLRSIQRQLAPVFGEGWLLR